MSRNIENCRSEYIRSVIQKHGGKKLMKYLGLIDPDDIDPEQVKVFKAFQKGNEYLIEYHLFEMIKSEIPMVMQWRLV